MTSVAPTEKQYVVFLICNDIDAFGHNAVFAQEIGAALADLGLASRVIDYRRAPQHLHEALRDDNCAFMVCFNGFGSEMSFAGSGHPTKLISVFDHYQKILFDLMHDCPSHEDMAHQMRVRDVSRQLLLTDYGYVQEAQELGFPCVRFVSSITFPQTLPPDVRARNDRPIGVLLPIQLPPPASVDVRFGKASGYRRRIFREIYEEVTDLCIANLRRDPRVETRRACRDIGIGFDPCDADHRFLLTTILDRTKFARRRDLVQALRGLPITIVTNSEAQGGLPEGFSSLPARSFTSLLNLMAEAACVLCPLPHMTGFHERALGAFTAGAAVITAPNDILETSFRHETDILMYQSSAELADLLPGLLADRDRLREIARSGQQAALGRFSPQRLAETMVSLSLASSSSRRTRVLESVSVT